MATLPSSDPPVVLSILGDDPSLSTTAQWHEWNTTFLRVVHNATIIKGDLNNFVVNNDPVGILLRPVLPDPLPNTLEGDRSLKQHEFRLRAYIQQQQGLNVVIAAFHSYTSPTVKDSIIAQLGGDSNALEHHPFPIIYAALKLRFGQTSSADLQMLHHKLSQPFTYENSDSLPTFINSMTKIFAIYQRANNPLSQHQQISYLIEAIQRSTANDTFRSTIFDWLRTHHDLTSALRTFPSLVSQLLITNSIAAPVSSSHPNYAYAASQPTSKPSPTTAAKKPTTQPPLPRFHYCWTHGTCSHPSNACLNKAIGHQDKATYPNQMGGKTPRDLKAPKA